MAAYLIASFMVAEFESLEQAKRWYNSPEYQAALPMRKNSTNRACPINQVRFRISSIRAI